jgi:hypothetical protein
MSDVQSQQAQLRSTIRSVPRSCRLHFINELLVSEIEQLGYDIAPDAKCDTVKAVFILATDAAARLGQVQHLIAREMGCSATCPLDANCQAA